MCGIFCYKGQVYDCTCLELVNAASQIGHRGPDDSRLKQVDDVSMIFHRLSIMDPTVNGMQPMSLDKVHLMCNGEIYNSRQLVKQLQFPITTECDCEVLLHLYHHFGRGREAIEQICKTIDAEFAFVIYDEENKTLYAARDFGIRPLFYSDNENGIFFSSEAKGIMPMIEKGQHIHPFPPRTFWDSNSKEFVRYFFFKEPSLPVSNLTNTKSSITRALDLSIYARLNSDRPIGFFLSGGLDSSLIVSRARNILGPKVEMHTFSIGIRAENEETKSPDIISARVVSKDKGTIHHEVSFTFNEALACIDELIYHLETFDTTTIRASAPQYLLCKYINENTNIKVLLSGEGSDELMFGYLMWHIAPNETEAQQASIELCENLYMFDCLRCDRTAAAHGLEIRVPFLSNKFIDVCNRINPRHKLPQDGLEKHLLRHSFEGTLPETILYRTKAAFSDAVGNLWIDKIKEFTNSVISDHDFDRSKKRYTHCTPRTKEELYYRRIFEKYFPGQDHMIKEFWKVKWNQQDDPSARFLPCYKD